MEYQVHSKASGRKTYHIIIVVFLMICVLMGALCLRYYQQLQDTVKNESSSYLQEISKQVASNAGRTINDNFAVLGTISTVLKSSNVDSYEQMQPIVLAQQSYWNFQSVMLIDGNGKAYDAYGNMVVLSGEEYLRDVIVNRKRAMSTSQVVNGGECIIFAIPVDGITINGTQVSALAASYELSTFDQILSVSAFDGRGYAHIIQKDGSIVVRSSSKYAPQMGYNILSSLSSAPMDGGIDVQQIKSEIALGNTGMVGMTVEGVHSYMVYTPLATKEWYLLGFVPVEVVNAKSEMMLQITLMICAFITLAFAALFAFLMFSSSRHKLKLEQIAYVDPVTGGNTIQRFYEMAGDLLEAPGKPQYALIYLNIEKFKILNEQFGRRVCDDMLKSISNGIADNLTNQESIGRLSADNFCILAEYKNEESLMKRFEIWYGSAEESQEQQGALWLSPIMEFGVYVISNDSMPFPHMIDRAKLALRETTNELRGKLRCAVYDDEVRRQLFREKHLEDMMEDALANREFQVYLQPKYQTQSEQIGGAEALVRWVSAAEGMIYPDEFISLFEKNGFIIQLDMWVFEEVCRSIRAWLDQGLEPVKVSVNCSRMHLKNPNFVQRYLDICNQCNTPPKFIEIELTENVVFEDVGHLSQVINEIHEAGFGCSMDDFGSGYSSLNLIQDIPVDTIKLDKIFFRSSKDLTRTESVVGSILNMSKLLKMATVAEGVEERVQVDMLKRLGCDLIQGYYFAKPMPVQDFEKLTFGRTVEKKIQ